MALAFSVSLAEILKVGLHDPSLFHHALFEFETSVSVGKEWSSWDEWVYRTWGEVTFGLGSRGSPWLKGKGAIQWSFCPCQFIEGALLAEMGFGGEKFCLHRFKGYGPIQYRAVDLSLGYTYCTECYGDITFAILQRVYSRNGPSGLTRLTLQLATSF